MKKLGICGTDKKLQSKPMKEIIKRIQNVDIYLMGNEFIYIKNVNQWPIVDYFICIGQKKDFPLEKAIQFCKLSNPVILNDLEFEKFLLSRKMIHKILLENQINTPLTLLSDKDSKIEQDQYSITVKFLFF